MQDEIVAPKIIGGERDGGSARDRAYAFVRQGILQRRFKSGAFLEEELVSTAVGVSRTPVREAFHRLAAERWLELVPRRGALVRQVTAQELLDVYEARRVLESHAVRQLCGRRLGVPASSRVVLEEMAGYGADSIEEHVRLDHQFHRGLVATLGNTVLIEMYDGLRARQQLVAVSAFGADPSRLQTILNEHAALLDAVAGHDGAAAEAVLSTHLRPISEIIARLDQTVPS